jgi:hypothetical protein
VNRRGRLLCPLILLWKPIIVEADLEKDRIFLLSQHWSAAEVFVNITFQLSLSQYIFGYNPSELMCMQVVPISNGQMLLSAIRPKKIHARSSFVCRVPHRCTMRSCEILGE